MEFGVTDHFAERTLARGLKPDILKFILIWGTTIHNSGVCHMVVVSRDLPPEIQRDPASHHAGKWVLVLSRDGTELITCYRNETAHKTVCAKPRDHRDATHRRNLHKPPKRRVVTFHS